MPEELAKRLTLGDKMTNLDKVNKVNHFLDVKHRFLMHTTDKSFIAYYMLE